MRKVRRSLSDAVQGEITFKKASELSREKAEENVEIKTPIQEPPKDRQERLGCILSTLENYPDGLNIRQFMSVIAHRWGVRAATVRDYFETLDRAGKIYVDYKLKVHLKKKKPI